jgi:cob(I)alamin adenosyltransferase
MKLYTKTGDDGTTGLYGGGRISKTSSRIKAIGDVDELNSVIGLARVHAHQDPLDSMLANIQNWLFDLGSELASPPDGKFQVANITDAHAIAVEQSIDLLSDQLPPLKAFILPGGSALGAQLHHARCVCRRAERSVIELSDAEAVRSEARLFLNRLSDWLFVAARTANVSKHVNDIEWTHSGKL